MRWVDEARSYLFLLLIAFCVLQFVFHFILVNAAVLSGSMYPLFDVKDRLLANRLSYFFSDPKCGDIVVFRYPDDPAQLFVKRVIGEGGDVVLIIRGKVYINDALTPLPEDYVVGYDTGDFGPYIVPEGMYFVLGDNRKLSLDSRYWDETYVAMEMILGKVFLRYAPNFQLF